MKKKSKFLLKRFKMLHLFRDDLEKIEYVFLKELKAERFNISTSEFEYQSVTEIPSDTLPTSDLIIQSFEPYLSINLDRNDAYLYSSENSLVTEGAFSELELILKDRQRVFWHFIMRFFPLYSITLAILSWIVPPNYIRQFPLLWVGFILVLIIWLIVSYVQTTRHYSVVEFAKKSARPSFMKKNKDQILVGLITGAIGIALTIIAYHLKLLK